MLHKTHQEVTKETNKSTIGLRVPQPTIWFNLKPVTH